MIIRNRPILSIEEIEAKAKELLVLFRPDFFDYTLPTNLLAIADLLAKKYRVHFDFRATLGFSENGERILGATNLKKWWILVDESLQKDMTLFNFTLAHELGHLALHRKISIIRSQDSNDESGDTINEVFSNIQNPMNEVQWLEYQANAYATALLMPAEMVRKKLILEQKQLGISKPGKIFIDHQPKNVEDSNQLILRLGHFFGVSNKAINDRLEKLELFEDEISNTKSINEIISLGDWMKSTENLESDI